MRGAIRDGRPYRDSNPFHPSRGPLAAVLPLFPSRLQFPVPLILNLLLVPGEHVFGRDVTDGAIQTHVVVMLYVTLTRRRASSSDSGVPGRMHSPLSDLCQRSILPFD